MSNYENGYASDGVRTPEEELVYYQAEISTHTDYLTQYLSRARIGSARFMALSDIVDYTNACTKLKQYQQRVAELDNDRDIDVDDPSHVYSDATKYASETEWRSNLRIAENIVAGIVVRVQNRDSAKPGYLRARSTILDRYYDLCEAREAEQTILMNQGLINLESQDEQDTPFDLLESALQTIKTGNGRRPRELPLLI